MSDDDQGTSLMREYNHNELQIVDIDPDEIERKKSSLIETHILPDKDVQVQEDGSSGDEKYKYIQVLDSDKNVVVDLLNLTLVKCEDGQESYRLVSGSENDSGGEETVTCVLSNGDGDEQDVESYVVMEGSEGPVVFLHSSNVEKSKPQPQPQQQPQPQAKPQPQTAQQDKQKETALTPVEILERAKSLQKAKSLATSATASRGRGRRGRSQLPPPHELLSSPQFKLYLYSCKLCSFKCNAIKELTAHKAAEHASGGGKWRAGGRGSTITLQCARCPYRGHTHSQLMKHVRDKHVEFTSKALLSSPAVHNADVLVCGACGFESAARDEFKAHIEDEHGVAAR